MCAVLSFRSLLTSLLQRGNNFRFINTSTFKDAFLDVQLTSLVKVILEIGASVMHQYFSHCRPYMQTLRTLFASTYAMCILTENVMSYLV